MSDFAVMGSPISHSHSPILHNAGFRHLGVEAEYVAVEKSSLGLKEALAYSGLSLTMPLKLDAFSITESHDEESRLTGVSNTLLNSSGQLAAMNTDVFGVSKALELTHCESVIIIGTGATAKSAALAVKDKKVSFLGRNTEKLNDIENWARGLNIEAGSTKSVDIVIDTTPGDVRFDYPDYRLVLDVAYGSNRNSGNPKLISGLEMLLHQAVLQNYAFSSMKISTDINMAELTEVMREALVSRVGEWSNA